MCVGGKFDFWGWFYCVKPVPPKLQHGAIAAMLGNRPNVGARPVEAESRSRMINIPRYLLR